LTPSREERRATGAWLHHTPQRAPGTTSFGCSSGSTPSLDLRRFDGDAVPFLDWPEDPEHTAFVRKRPPRFQGEPPPVLDRSAHSIER